MTEHDWKYLKVHRGMSLNYGHAHQCNSCKMIIHTQSHTKSALLGRLYKNDLMSCEEYLAQNIIEA